MHPIPDVSLCGRAAPAVCHGRRITVDGLRAEHSLRPPLKCSGRRPAAYTVEDGRFLALAVRAP
ncbi:hypothetical protein [Streptomyces sp. NPDC018000]|uniref:hypothetical protein n=1 Tax=Streptomyces sp. NPDC018000 TaxID=3365028 RepID=UPI00379D3565